MNLPANEWPDAVATFALSSIDPLAVLGVEADTNKEAIQRAYRGKVVMYHPDKVHGMAPEFQQVAHQKMSEINAAYELLRQRGAL